MGYEPTIQLTSEEVTIPSYAELDKSYIDIEATSNVAFEVVAPEDLDWLTLEENLNILLQRQFLVSRNSVLDLRLIQSLIKYVLHR